MTAAQRVLAWLPQHPGATSTEIAEAVGCAAGTVQQCIQPMLRSGQVERRRVGLRVQYRVGGARTWGAAPTLEQGRSLGGWTLIRLRAACATDGGRVWWVRCRAGHERWAGESSLASASVRCSECMSATRRQRQTMAERLAARLGQPRVIAAVNPWDYGAAVRARVTPEEYAALATRAPAGVMPPAMATWDALRDSGVWSTCRELAAAMDRHPTTLSGHLHALHRAGLVEHQPGDHHTRGMTPGRWRAVVAEAERRIGWERDPEYHEVARKRLAMTREQLGLFATGAV